MSVKDAIPGDIYTDNSGKLWRVISVLHEPSVEVQEVEGGTDKRRIRSEIDGLIWNGWTRIWRRDPTFGLSPLLLKHLTQKAGGDGRSSSEQ